MSINANSHVPIFKQIVEHIRTAIAAGIYQSGEALPSLRALALELMVNPNTVQRAYEELERDGLVYSRRGLGLFVAEKGSRSARSQSQEAVEKSFLEGVRLAHSVGFTTQEVRRIFDKTLTRRTDKAGGNS
jgi:GntR family transcriptional regulator